jgi:hypothetical protein
LSWFADSILSIRKLSAVSYQPSAKSDGSRLFV